MEPKISYPTSVEICTVGDTSYLSLPIPASPGGARADDEVWSLRLDRLLIDVTPTASIEPSRVVARLSSDALPVDDKGNVAIADAKLVIKGTEIPIEIACGRIAAPARVRGNISSISPKGELIGWATDPLNRSNHVPVEVSLGGRMLLTIADKPWPTDQLQRFKVRLPSIGDAEGPLRLDVKSRGAARPFQRSPSYVIYTEIGWAMAAPVNVVDDALEGAFIFSAHPIIAVGLNGSAVGVALTSRRLS